MVLFLKDNESERFRATPSKRRSSTPENDVVHLPVILDDDFEVRPEACLSEIATEKYEHFIPRMERVLFGLFERLRYVQAHLSDSFGIFAQRLAKQMVSRKTDALEIRLLPG